MSESFMNSDIKDFGRIFKLDLGLYRVSVKSFKGYLLAWRSVHISYRHELFRLGHHHVSAT